MVLEKAVSFAKNIDFVSYARLVLIVLSLVVVVSFVNSLRIREIKNESIANLQSQVALQDHKIASLTEQIEAGSFSNAGGEIFWLDASMIEDKAAAWEDIVEEIKSESPEDIEMPNGYIYLAIPTAEIDRFAKYWVFR